MSQYSFQTIEQKWQQFWSEKQTFKTSKEKNKPKYYVLDMFPYPSGTGLHVGHPLGYIASDVLARYKRLQGFNVLHPMGWDSFGLPAEQYAIQTGQHPAKTTAQNSQKYHEQLNQIGLSFDWSRSVSTCEPKYYKHTQKTFLDLFSHYYDKEKNKAIIISDLIKKFEIEGNTKVFAATNLEEKFSSSEWINFSHSKKEEILQHYRLAYLADSWVNWCPNLGTVLANDEVKDGLSVRGGHPVEQKKMKQWQLRITAYADRLLEGLDTIDWPEAVKEMQRNWIGKSAGAEILFNIANSDLSLEIFTTRPDTIFGVSFMVLAPEHMHVPAITTAQQKNEVEQYLIQSKKKTERERLTEVKKMSGVFTGSYCIHPWTKEKIPLWISDYVLAGYGTGAIMAVPAHDQRDYNFARTYNLPINPILENVDVSQEASEQKNGRLANSQFLNGLTVEAAIEKMFQSIVEKKIGNKKINYKLRDAIFSRQRYWGEPIPMYYKDGHIKPLSVSELPLELPPVDVYLPTEKGEPPLARAKNWKPQLGDHYEYSTMPGFAGSCAYFLRYMDPDNKEQIASDSELNYWGQVDFYVGGSEHATGHLLYSRFWNNFLFDQGIAKHKEPFKKLFNQGMILGRSNFVYREKGTNTFITFSKIKNFDVQQFHVDVNFVKNDILDTELFKQWRPEFKDAKFILNDNSQYECGVAIEKMSKSFYNIVNPETIINEFGADSFRLYEMFLGPLEQSKPWNTNGLEGVFRFVNKLWRLVIDDSGSIKTFNDKPSNSELKIIHTAIKKVKEDLENFTLNTSVSALMICVNDLGKLDKLHKSTVESLVIILSPYAPHVAEELWQKIGHETSITFATFPKVEEKYLLETSFNYPISINGKLKFTHELDLALNAKVIEEIILKLPQTQKILGDSVVKKVVVVPNKIVNIVI